MCGTLVFHKFEVPGWLRPYFSLPMVEMEKIEGCGGDEGECVPAVEDFANGVGACSVIG